MGGRASLLSSMASGRLYGQFSGALMLLAPMGLAPAIIASACDSQDQGPRSRSLSAIEVISVFMVSRWRHWVGMASTP